MLLKKLTKHINKICKNKVLRVNNTLLIFRQATVNQNGIEVAGYDDLENNIKETLNLKGIMGFNSEKDDWLKEQYLEIWRDINGKAGADIIYIY